MTRPAPELFLQRGSAVQRYTLPSGSVSLGRASSCDVVLDDAHVSRQHAQLTWDGTTLRVSDLGSANGTHVDDVRLTDGLLDHGQKLRLGDTVLRVRFPDRDPDATVAMVDTDPPADTDDTSTPEVLATELHRRPEPVLLVCVGNDITEHVIRTDTVTIGRDATCDLVIPHDSVSRLHARIERTGTACVVHDAASRNGILVNGARAARQRLADGDTIRIGDVRLVFADAVSDLEPEPTPDLLPRRPVVLVPGFMGSELWAGRERLWPEWTRFVYDPSMLRVDDTDRVAVGGIVQEVVLAAGFIKLDCFSRLTDFLVDAMGYTRGVDLLEFAYDWRRDIRSAARRLGEAIETWRATSAAAREGPVTIVAHSMGSLVSRYYVNVLGGDRDVEQLVVLGGPHLGLPEAVATLTSGARLPRVPIPQLRSLSERMRSTVYGFESIYQLVPEYTCVEHAVDGQVVPLASDAWLPHAHRARLGLGRELRRELRTPSRVPTLSVVGYGQPTVTHMHVTPDTRSAGLRLRPQLDLNGDGLVPTCSASLAGSNILPVRQTHGTLFVDRDVRRRLRRMLRVGTVRVR